MGVAEETYVTNMTTPIIDLSQIVHHQLYQVELVSNLNEGSVSDNAVIKIRSKNHGESSKQNANQSPKYVDHEVVMHNIDATLTGASSFINQAV